MGGGKAVDRRDVDGESPPRELLASRRRRSGRRRPDRPVPPEDRVGVGKPGEEFGSPTGDRSDVRNPERLGVGLDQGEVAGLGLDGGNDPLASKLPRLDHRQASPLSQTTLVGLMSS